MLSVVYIQGLAALTHERLNDELIAPLADRAQPTTETAAASSAAPELERLLTHEDVDRARDRWEVVRARRKGAAGSFGGVRLLWLLIGPGVLVFLGENDAPSMLSYAATGARLESAFFFPLWSLLLRWASWCRK